MLNVLPYKKELLSSFVYDGIESQITTSQIVSMVEFYAKLGKVYVGFVENKVIGVGGVYPLWEKSGGCFLFLNHIAKDYKLSVFKTLLKYMNILIKKFGIKTLIVECMDNSLKANNLINHLGFQKNREFKMNMYSRQERL